MPGADESLDMLTAVASILQCPTSTIIRFRVPGSVHGLAWSMRCLRHLCVGANAPPEDLAGWLTSGRMEINGFYTETCTAYAPWWSQCRECIVENNKAEHDAHLRSKY